MAHSEDTVWCDNCGVEIYWGWIVDGHSDYCCQDCKDGLPCDCGERMEFDDERRSQAGEAISYIQYTA